MKPSLPFSLSLIAAAWLGGALLPASGQITYQRLASFGAADQSAAGPQAPLIRATNGLLYGTTYYGGRDGKGTVYQLNPDGTGYAVLHSFTAAGGDGQNPAGALVQVRDGALLGTTVAGGTNGVGTVFRLNLDGSGYAVLHSFTSTGGDGQKPQAALIQGQDGALYGTTSAGGAGNVGTIFKLAPDGSGYAVLRPFSNSGNDGQRPSAALVQAPDGLIYGATAFGGASGMGTVFVIDANGGNYATLHSLNPTNAEGQYPVANLALASDGTLFGTAFAGGSNQLGTVFKLGTNGNSFAVLHHFRPDGGDGQNPQAALRLGADGWLYGTTLNGGSGLGTVFRLSPDGSGYTIQHRFQTAGADGQNPYAALVQDDAGTLYGTTFAGGGSAAGAIYKLNPDGSGYSLLLALSSSGGTGQNPYASLLRGQDGSYYGTAYAGGALAGGAVFQLSADGGNYTVLHSFSSLDGDGQNPVAPLVQGTNGLLYGTTYFGGSNNAGVVFALATNGTGYTVLHQFRTNGIDGQNPYAALLAASDGRLYGTTAVGGTNRAGTVFRLQPDGGGYQVLHHFDARTGQNPQAALLQARDGALYGTTYGGGLSNAGTVFTMQLDGSGFAVLKNFGGADGEKPHAPLWQAPDGTLYGTANAGGAAGFGTVFTLGTSGGNFAVLYDFGVSADDGRNPIAGLALGADGWLYGTTYYGGTNGVGVLFQLALSGSNYAVVHSFGSTSGDGKNPNAALIAGTGGALYGTTSAGGDLNVGTVYLVTTPILAVPPAITTQPVSRTVPAGTEVTFTAVVSGSEPLHYFWLLNGTNLPGATHATLTLTDVSRLQAGDYSLRVTNAAGTALSSNATLIVAVPQQLQAPLILPDSTFQLLSVYGESSPILAGELGSFEAQISSDLETWSALPNSLSWSNGVLVLHDTNSAALPVRFYRIIQR